MPMDMMPLGDSPTPMSSAGAAGGAGMAVPSLQNGGAPAPQAGQPSGLESFMNQAGPGIAGIIAALGAKAMGNRSGPAARLAIGLEQARIQRANQQKQQAEQQRRQKIEERRQQLNDMHRRYEIAVGLDLPKKQLEPMRNELLLAYGIEPGNIAMTAAMDMFPSLVSKVLGGQSLKDVPVEQIAGVLKLADENREWAKSPEGQTILSAVNFKLRTDQSLAAKVVEINTLSGPLADAAAARAEATAEATAKVTSTGGGAEARVDSIFASYELATGEPLDEKFRSLVEDMAGDPSAWQQNVSQFWLARNPKKIRELEFVQKWKEFETSFFGETGEIERRAIGEEIKRELEDKGVKPTDPDFQSKLVFAVQRLASTSISHSTMEPIFSKLGPVAQRKAVGKFTAWMLEVIYGQGMTDKEAAANFPGGG